MTINPKAPEKEVQQKLIDISTEFNLTQVHDTPTRENNLLDIVLTTNATLVKSSTNIPGLSDHDIIITDAIIKPTYNKNKPQKRYLYSKANWDKIDNESRRFGVLKSDSTHHFFRNACTKSGSLRFSQFSGC
jgi:hypothetical protein